MKCIFHMPLPLDKNSKSASGIRPQKMLQAFKDIGYEVFEITGYGKERKRSIQMVKEQIINGEKFDFLYSESSTMPTLLTEKHHYPTHPFLDFSFFKFCKKHNIKIGLFYRDIYWKFDDLYKKSLPGWKYFFAIKAYQYDLVRYGQLLSKLYVPSAMIYPYIQNKNITPILDTLPPGCDRRVFKSEKNILNQDYIKEPLKIFYVGGLGEEYKLLELFKAVSTIPTCDLTVCCRENEWEKNKAEYIEYIKCSNIHIIHKSGSELDSYYNNSDICSLIFKPDDYRNLAVPFKAFEYLSWEKPVLVSRNTLIGNFVSDNNTGWLVEYSAESIRKTILEIIDKPNELLHKIECCKIAKENNLWIVRAEKVAHDLIKYNN